jgi:predicted GTPase
MAAFSRDRKFELVRGGSRSLPQEEDNMTLSSIVEQIQVAGKDLVAHVNRLIKEGNVRRIVIRDESGHTFMEIPVTVAAVGVIVAPDDPESIRGAKEWLTRHMERGRSYSETLDQPSFAARFDLQAARALPSFSKPLQLRWKG